MASSGRFCVRRFCCSPKLLSKLLPGGTGHHCVPTSPLPALKNTSQGGFSTDSFHLKPGPNLQLQNLPAPKPPSSTRSRGQGGCHSCNSGRRFHTAAFISAPRVRSCAKSLRVLHLKNLRLSSGISLPGGREGAPCRVVHLMLPIVPTLESSDPVLVNNKSRIFLLELRKSRNLFLRLEKRCSQMEKLGLSQLNGQAPLPPVNSTRSPCRNLGRFWVKPIFCQVNGLNCSKKWLVKQVAEAW